jgi:hypothetical protein
MKGIKYTKNPSGYIFKKINWKTTSSLL